jgi:2',3'-cyclic-nucleotide 2'-phosphodiesterase (5'-nucleotidase family)
MFARATGSRFPPWASASRRSSQASQVGISFVNAFNKHNKKVWWAHGVGAIALAASSALAACQGCRSTPGGASGPSANGTDPVAAAAESIPTLRLYVVSDLAGALEPCGCTEDQLGGFDHAAAWIRAQHASAPNAAVVSAGPLFFMDPKLKDDHRDQDVAKAETIAASLKTVGFAAFAPGANEWAAGDAELGKLTAASGGALLFANGSSARGEGASGDGAKLGDWVVRDIGGVKVGLVGVSTAGEGPSLAPPPAVRLSPAPEAIARGIEALKKDGAQVFIALAAIGRGDAKRLADRVPALTAIVVGSPGGTGDLNAPAPPPERIGDVLILQTGNHLTTVGALDLFVRGGSFAFADATGLELGQKRDELGRRIDDLRNRIALWEHDSTVRKEDLDARRAEVTKLTQDLAALDVHPAPARGSFFRYASQEIRKNLGSDAEVRDATLAYYKQINDHNRTLFAGRMPPPAAPDQATYIGVDACTKCHKEARAVWDGTKHAHAYATLADQQKQFNLDCVSCHVTGYEEPGGSTVTHVAGLENVGCEVCHGPGSKHARDPKRVKLAEPRGDRCLSCHHPPHVEGFDPDKKMADILGPGHGL